MIFDHRTYELHPGKLKDFLALYQNEGYPVQTRHLGKPFAWFTTEVGNVNEIVHIWAYEDVADRARRRAAMQADPAWQAYLAKTAGIFKTMNNKLVVPAPFMTAK
ncbi:MAG: NIPSNAP family protein [Rhodospirillales bacterium]|nr:NIPSNAP family protein [Rhodospirillales bacterium]